MRLIGFSTGAVAKGDVERALALLSSHRLSAVELSALRLNELPRLVEMAEGLNLKAYQYVSVHAPSHFEVGDERFVIGKLSKLAARGWPIVVHPDVIYTDASWQSFGNNLMIENSDRRKLVGRTADELEELFRRFPGATFCFDVGHARQVDPTMNEAHRILGRNSDRLRQVHLSEVNFFSRHDPLSSAGIEATQRVARLIPERVPVILETLIDQGQSTIETEIRRAEEALRPVPEAVS